MIDLTNPELLILALGSLGLGIWMLLKGGTWTIDAAVFVARKAHISPLIIGFTIVAFGTSLPELIVSINANLTGSPGIAIGNVIGSNIANILFVLGMTAVFSVLVVKPREILRDSAVMLLATALMIGLFLTGGVSQIAGIAMIVLLVGYVIWQYWLAKTGHIPVEVEDAEFPHLYAALAFLLLGLIFIAVGAEFLVRGAKVSASIIGVPDAVIGLTVIAIGTSLPELSTCIAAALKKHTDLVIGNILGSNVFNILMILGATALVKPISEDGIAQQVINFDIWVVLGVSVLLTAIMLIFKTINRPIGIGFLAAYVLYIGGLYAIYLGDVTLLEPVQVMP